MRVVLRLYLLMALAAGPAGASGFAALTAAGQAMSAPQLTLRDWHGVPRELSEFRGKVVLVNFWASWCEACREEMPDLEKLRQKYGERGFEIVAVNLGESQRRVQSFTKTILPNGMSFVILQDRNSIAYKAWQVRALPANFLLDREGHIRSQVLGRIDISDSGLAPAIEALLAEVGGQSTRTTD